jgi:hypothetical protein
MYIYVKLSKKEQNTKKKDGPPCALGHHHHVRSLLPAIDVASRLASFSLAGSHGYFTAQLLQFAGRCAIHRCRCCDVVTGSRRPLGRPVPPEPDMKARQGKAGGACCRDFAGRHRDSASRCHLPAAALHLVSWSTSQPPSRPRTSGRVRTHPQPSMVGAN